ncbi:uncharacterized protein C6orf118-like [Xyrichtys novacula]|uniref:Uncharacterized protein C6orf118-like n=1 Tax=Xyrichtys novacula TaxID=13765 RepID=A0AAV1G3M8_XYRNO|nr:uncharacterized protein C6orf118-like [Xyrichtys novacula]
MSIRKEDLRSDVHRLLLTAEVGQKDDLLTYSSGHLGPHSLNQNPPHREVEKSFWRRSQGNEGAPNSLQTDVHREEMKGGPLKSNTGETLGESEVRRSKKDQDKPDEDLNRPETVVSSPNSSHVQQETFRSSPDPEKKLKDLSFSDTEGLKTEGHFKTKQVSRLETDEQELWAGGNIAEKHERKLQKELQKLSEHSRPSRDRLAAFSDVFDDVCESSPVFGRILREIKTDYDLYVDHLMASQPQHSSLKVSPEDVCRAKLREMQLEEAGKEVHDLEQEVRGALEENQRARNDSHKLTANVDLEERERTELRTDVSVQSKRLQLFDVWREIQLLEEEMEEKLVPEATIAAADGQTRDVKREIMRLITTNHRLETANKAEEFDLLPLNINMRSDKRHQRRPGQRESQQSHKTDPVGGSTV